MRGFQGLSIVLGAAGAASAGLTSSSFDADNELWNVANAATSAVQSAFGSAAYSPTGGNDSGYITAPDGWAGELFFVAPDSYHGDASALFGGSIEFDRHPSINGGFGGGFQTNFDTDITLSGNGLTLAFDLLPMAHFAWGHAEIPVDVGTGWFNYVTGDPATAGEFAAVLGNVDDFRLRGNLRRDGGYIGADNISFVPAPSAIALLGLALAGASRRRR